MAALHEWLVRAEHHGVRLLIVLCLLRVALIGGAYATGLREPFLGGNAEEHYLPTALRMYQEGRFNGPESRADSKIGPGYPLVLALLLPAGETALPYLVTLLQSLSDGLVALVLLALGRSLGWRLPGLLAGAGWLLFPPGVVISTWVTAETFYTLLFVSAMALLLLALRHDELPWSYGTGVLLGMAALFRMNAVPVLAVVAPVYALVALPWLRRGQHYLAMLLGAATLILPWTLRNRIVLDDPILVCVGSGAALMQGADERVWEDTHKRRHYRAFKGEAYAANIRPPDGRRESQVDQYMGRIGLYLHQQRWRERPGSYVGFCARKLARIWYATETPRKLRRLAIGLCSLLVVPAAIVGLWQTRRRQPRWSALIALLLLSSIVIQMVIVAIFRYNVTFFPLLLLAAATAYCRWFGWTEPAPDGGAAAPGADGRGGTDHDGTRTAAGPAPPAAL